jgi:uncharacterized membrane protein YfcA
MEEQNVLVFVLVGFVAQIIDGTLGMAYGVSSNTFLLSLGIPPAVASASVHAAEVVITGISGLFHWQFGNVHPDLVKRLLIPGMVGGMMGACLLTSVDATVIKPFVAVYLVTMGLVILGKAFAKPEHREVRTGLIPLGFVDGCHWWRGLGTHRDFHAGGSG